MCCLLQSPSTSCRREQAHSSRCAKPFESRLQLDGADRETIERYRLQAHHDAERQLRTFMEGLAPEAFSRLNARLRRGHAVTVLTEDARAHAADVIAIGKHGGNTFTESIFGSVAHGVLQSAACDVLVVS